MKSNMARVVVIGTSCAGKTTFARSLARILIFPHIELDALHWLPNWMERPADDFRALTAQALTQDCWVTDGNYANDLTWSRATTVIWLNYAFPTVLWRALTRTLRRAVTREELFAGNRESLRMAFLSRESILWWVVTTFHRRRKLYRSLFDARTSSHLAYVEFRNPTEAQFFLTKLEATLQNANAVKATALRCRATTLMRRFRPVVIPPRSCLNLNQIFNHPLTSRVQSCVLVSKNKSSNSE